MSGQEANAGEDGNISGKEANGSENGGFLAVILEHHTAIIAYISLVLALLLLWLGHFRSFSPSVEFGSVYLIPKFDPKANNTKLRIGVPVTFFNKGARAGVLQDLAIKMEKVGEGEYRAIYFPYIVYDSHEWLVNRMQKEPELLALKGAFGGIYTPPGELIQKEIMFSIGGTPTQLKLEPGDYRFTFWMKKQHGGYEKVETRVEKITQKTLDNLGFKTVTWFLPHKLREDFVKENSSGI